MFNISPDEWLSKCKQDYDSVASELRNWSLYGQCPVLVASSPPGGGKSTRVNELTILISCLLNDWRSTGGRPPALLLVAQTHDQVQALISELLNSCKLLPIVVYGAAGEDKHWNSELLEHSSEKFRGLQKSKDIVDAMERITFDPPAEDEAVSWRNSQAVARILVTNKAKLLTTLASITQSTLWDYGLVDEAYQMGGDAMALMYDCCQRWILVGDSGQIAPFSQAKRYELDHFADGASPALSAPVSLRRMGIPMHEVKLPVSWRLPHDTVQYLNNDFYPELPFIGAGLPSRRTLKLEPNSQGDAIDLALEGIAKGESLQMVTLASPPPLTEVDRDLLKLAVMIIQRLHSRKAELIDADKPFVDDPSLASPVAFNDNEILILTGRSNEAAQLQALLNSHGTGGIVRSATGISTTGTDPEKHYLETVMDGINEDEEEATRIDTANRLQGLERRLVIAIHPCSYLSELEPFALDRGRLSVMLSRHRIGCILLSREHLSELLEEPYLHPERSVSSEVSDETESTHEGLEAHRNLLARLASEGRVHRATATASYLD